MSQAFSFVGSQLFLFCFAFLYETHLAKKNLCSKTHEREIMNQP